MSAVDPLRSTDLRIVDRSPRSWRTVTDEDGRVWRVREITFADTTPSLVFECEVGFRRIRSYPDDWQTMSDAELYRLSWRT